MCDYRDEPATIGQSNALAADYYDDSELAKIKKIAPERSAVVAGGVVAAENNATASFADQGLLFTSADWIEELQENTRHQSVLGFSSRVIFANTPNFG